MLPSRARGQRGITLIEILLWTAIVAAGAAALFVFSKKASVAAAVETEQRQVEDIVKTVDGLFATQPNFAALGANGAAYLKERAARSGLKFGNSDSGAPVLLTGLGGGKGTLTLSVQSVTLPAGPSLPNNGYRLAYNGLSADECVRLVTASYPIAHRVRVSHDADDATGVRLAARGQLTVTPDEIANNCAASASPSVFLYFVPSRAIAASTPPIAPPAARCAPVHETQQASCPAGQVGTITQERDGTCTGPGNTMVYTAWTTIDNTCQVAPPVPPPVTPPVVPDDCTLINATRVLACPLGQIGHIIEESQRDTCAGTSTPWVTPPGGNSCQPPPPPGTCTPATEDRLQACPAGQGGTITQARSSRCTSPTAIPEWIVDADTDSNGWRIVSNTCTSACDQGGTSCCTVQRQTRPGPTCPAGTYGTAGEQESFLGCVNSQTQSSTWTPWQDFTGGSCTACPADVPETNIQWVARQDACPAGQTGAIDYEIEQVQTRTISYSCPAGTTTLPAPTTSPWGSWADTGASRNHVNNCTTAPPSAMGYRWKPLMLENGYFFYYGEQSISPWITHGYTPAPAHPAVFHATPPAALLNAVRSAEAKTLTPWTNNPVFVGMTGEAVQYRTTSTDDAWPAIVGGQNRHDNRVTCSSANVGEVLMTQEAGSCFSNLMGGCANAVFPVSQYYFECVHEEMPTPTGGWLLKDVNAFVPGTCPGYPSGTPYVRIVGPSYDQTFTGTAAYTPFDPITGVGLNDMDWHVMGVDGTAGPHPLDCDDAKQGWEITVEKRCMPTDITNRRNGTTTYVCNGTKAALDRSFQMYAYVSDNSASASCSGSTSYARIQFTNSPNGSLDQTSGAILRNGTVMPSFSYGDYTASDGFGGFGYWWDQALPAHATGRGDAQAFFRQVEAFNPQVTACNASSIGTRKVTMTCDNNTLTTITHECQSYPYAAGTAEMGNGVYNNPQPGYSQN